MSGGTGFHGRCAVPMTWLFPFGAARLAPRAYRGALDKRQRLRRWTELLGRNPRQMLRLLPPTWCLKPGEQQTVKTAGSALEIAFRDPVLRLDGLAGPSLADAMAFFELSADDADRILAKSRHSEERSAHDTIVRIENIADKRREHRLFAMLLGMVILIAAALSYLLR